MGIWNRSHAGQPSAKLGFVGLTMFFGAMSGMVWNEMRTAKQFNALSELEANAVTVSAERIDSSHDQKPVHLAGMASTDVGVRDPIFPIGGDDILKVRRSVEMYQWVEKSDSKDSSKKTYTSRWSTRSESGGSGHRNPDFPIDSNTELASDVQLGAFALAGRHVDQLSGEHAALPAEIPEVLANDGWIASTQGWFRGKGKPNSPEIGDVRVSFNLVREGTLSVMAAQSGQALAPYSAKNGVALFLIDQGQQTAANLLQSARTENTIMAYVIRGVSTFMMTMGMGFAFSGLVSWFTRIPVVGPLIERFAFGVGALVGFCLSVTVFVGAWLWAHPIWLGLAAAAIAAIVWMVMRRKASGVPPSMPPSAPPPMPPPFAGR